MREKDKHKFRWLVFRPAKREGFVQDLATVRSEQLQGIVNAFVSNTGRAHALALAFAEIACTVRRDQWCMDRARLKIESDMQSPFCDTPVSEALQNEFHAQRAIWEKDSPESRSSLIGHFGVRYVQELVQSNPRMDVSMDALMSSVIIESWIAFESMVADLWVTAVDSGPAILRKRVLLKTIKAGNAGDPVVDFTSADDIEHDPARKLGSALRQARKVSFQKLSLIVRNYEIAFTSRVKTIFEQENGYIATLAAYRNALIHNAGKADSTFRNQIKGFKEFEGLGLNQKLILDGELVHTLRHVAAAVGAKLIHYVDDVLTPP
jgi:hypothetical protein